MASTADDVRSLADKLSQDDSSRGVVAPSTSSTKAALSSPEHPPFDFQPVELADLSNSRGETQPAASTSSITPAAADSRKENLPPHSSPDASMSQDPNSSESHSKPSEPISSPPSKSTANIPASPSNPATSTPSLPMPPQSAHHQDMQRIDTVPAIGAASDNPHSDVEPAEITSTMLMITLLLNTGARHAFKLDDKYLKKRNVTVEEDNPINLSVYTLKELIWRDWRGDWDPRPASPSSIRLIHFGKLLEDKNHLREGRFANGDTQHVVHMTVKPQEVIDDEDARIAKGAGRSGEDGERSPGCRCVIL